MFRLLEPASHLAAKNPAVRVLDPEKVVSPSDVFDPLRERLTTRQGEGAAQTGGMGVGVGEFRHRECPGQVSRGAVLGESDALVYFDEMVQAGHPGNGVGVEALLPLRPEWMRVAEPEPLLTAVLREPPEVAHGGDGHQVPVLLRVQAVDQFVDGVTDILDVEHVDLDATHDTRRTMREGGDFVVVGEGEPGQAMAPRPGEHLFRMEALVRNRVHRTRVGVEVGRAITLSLQAGLLPGCDESRLRTLYRTVPPRFGKKGPYWRRPE